MAATNASICFADFDQSNLTLRSCSTLSLSLFWPNPVVHRWDPHRSRQRFATPMIGQSSRCNYAIGPHRGRRTPEFGPNNLAGSSSPDVSPRLYIARVSAGVRRNGIPVPPSIQVVGWSREITTERPRLFLFRRLMRERGPVLHRGACTFVEWGSICRR